MKKILAIILAMTVSLVLFGCDGGNGGAGNNGGANNNGGTNNGGTNQNGDKTVYTEADFKLYDADGKVVAEATETEPYISLSMNEGAKTNRGVKAGDDAAKAIDKYYLALGLATYMDFNATELNYVPLTEDVDLKALISAGGTLGIQLLFDKEFAPADALLLVNDSADVNVYEECSYSMLIIISGGVIADISISACVDIYGGEAG